MTLTPELHQYPRRRYGMDHDRYEWSLLHRRRPIAWPGQKTIALRITIPVEVFPLNDDGRPFKLPGTMAKPYPDLQTYSWRDYGNRVGIYRLMDAAQRFGLTPDWAVNAAVVGKYPRLFDDILAQPGEVIAHGYDMASPHHGGLGHADERAIVERCLSLLEQRGGKRPRGWLSPGQSESARTPEILAECAIEYMCDWPNDELPYHFRTAAGDIVAMPHSSELDDRRIIVEYRHHEVSFSEQVKDHYRYLSREAAEQGGRVMSLNLHPWVTGQSHRIDMLEGLLEFLASREDVWIASGGAILDAWNASLNTWE